MRYIAPYVLKDLEKKMVFIGGPRQVGKTTLARAILDEDYPKGAYFNWDFDEDRQDILKKKWSSENTLLVFDELHKFPRWKNWIKGIYDVGHDSHSFLVTGSARLDVYRRGGDSLMGRYHYWRLHPFTLDEVPKGLTPKEAFRRLMTVGGFPEPFLDPDDRDARRWRRERFDRVLREDVRDLESVRNIQLLSLFWICCGGGSEAWLPHPILPPTFRFLQRRQRHGLKSLSGCILFLRSDPIPNRCLGPF